MAKLSADDWSGCPVRYAATVLGDAWTLLILRDLAFKGSRHFGDFVAAPEGVSTNILTDRLKRLEGAGVVVRQRDPDQAVRVIYDLTEKGRDLVPVLLAMIRWSDRWDDRSEVPAAFAETCRDDAAALADAIIADLARRALPAGAASDVAASPDAGQAEGNQQP